MFEDNPSKVFRPEDVGVEEATRTYEEWCRKLRFLAEGLRGRGHDEEAIYRALAAYSEEAGEEEEMLAEILYSDGSSLPARSVEDERDAMIDRLNASLDALEPKVREGDAEAVEADKQIRERIDELRRNAP